MLERYPRLLQNYGFAKQGGNSNEIQGIAIDKKKKTKDPISKIAVSKEFRQLSLDFSIILCNFDILYISTNSIVTFLVQKNKNYDL